MASIDYEALYDLMLDAYQNLDWDEHSDDVLLVVKDIEKTKHNQDLLKKFCERVKVKWQAGAKHHTISCAYCLDHKIYISHEVIVAEPNTDIALTQIDMSFDPTYKQSK